jgi:tRNA(Ile2) C34 agmatinyltransferase TiaS
MINRTNDTQNSPRCPYCNNEKQVGKFACSECWRRIPRELRDGIAAAREVCIRWLDEHSPAKRGTSGRAIEIGKPQF